VGRIASPPADVAPLVRPSAREVALMSYEDEPPEGDVTDEESIEEWWRWHMEHEPPDPSTTARGGTPIPPWSITVDPGEYL
jgi:hypothetical protein